MREVKMDTTKLLAKVTANRAKHRSVFEAALEGWKKAVLAALERMVADARAGLKYVTLVPLQRPSDHTADYDTVISMLNDSVEATTILKQEEYRCYVMDEWGWRQGFIAASTAYAAQTVADVYGEGASPADDLP